MFLRCKYIEKIEYVSKTYLKWFKLCVTFSDKYSQLNFTRSFDLRNPMSKSKLALDSLAISCDIHVYTMHALYARMERLIRTMIIYVI